jgi:hypothetical protein
MKRKPLSRRAQVARCRRELEEVTRRFLGYESLSECAGVFKQMDAIIAHIDRIRRRREVTP